MPNMTATKLIKDFIEKPNEFTDSPAKLTMQELKAFRDSMSREQYIEYAQQAANAMGLTDVTIE